LAAVVDVAVVVVDAQLKKCIGEMWDEHNIFIVESL
jgi:hypothetical protein